MLVRFPRVVAPVKLAQICGVGHYRSLCLHRARPREGRTDREREREWRVLACFVFLYVYFVVCCWPFCCGH